MKELNEVALHYCLAACLAAAVSTLALCSSSAWAQPVPAAAQPAAARPAGGPLPSYGPVISLEQAKIAVAAAEAEAHRLNVPAPALAVVEPSGDIVLLEKGTGASYGAVDAALEKARSAGRYRLATPPFDNTRSFPSGFVTGLGGVPLIVNGRIVGAIAQGGVPGDALVKAAAAALQ